MGHALRRAERNVRIRQRNVEMRGLAPLALLAHERNRVVFQGSADLLRACPVT